MKFVNAITEKFLTHCGKYQTCEILSKHHILLLHSWLSLAAIWKINKTMHTLGSKSV
jgi:hypothetical protein